VRRTGVFSRRGPDVTRAPSNLAVSRAVAWVTQIQGSAEVQPLPNDKEDLGYVRNRSIPTLCITCDSSNIYVRTLRYLLRYEATLPYPPRTTFAGLVHLGRYQRRSESVWSGSCFHQHLKVNPK
jgi:hypothetical protein